MALKHNVRDADEHFIVDADSRKIIKQSSGKSHLMQYDHNSEVFTFEVPLKVENHDMSLCDLIQIHFENTSTGTSVSVRKMARDVRDIKKEDIEVNEDHIAFSWIIDDGATQFAGPLKFQLKFICFDDEEAGVKGYKWHTDVNEDINVKAGLGYSDGDLPPAAKATLQSVMIAESDTGVDIILDGVHYPVYHGKDGVSGVYVGSGEMPEHCNVQIDPTGTDVDYTSTEEVTASLTEIDTLLGG